MTEQRLIDLEIKISHQEVTIDALQQIVYELQRAVDKLNAKLEQVDKQLTGSLDQDIGPANEKPPHY